MSAPPPILAGLAPQNIKGVSRARRRDGHKGFSRQTRQDPPLGAEQAVVKAWRLRPFKPSPPAQSELESAFELREAFRARGFDLRLGRDGSVVVADLTGQYRAAPPALTKTLWKHVEVVGALLERRLRK